MKTLKLAVCFLDENDNIITKRTLKSKWSVNVEQDLMKFHAVNALDEISNILTEYFKLELNPDIIREMLDEVKAIE